MFTKDVFPCGPATSDASHAWHLPRSDDCALGNVAVYTPQFCHELCTLLGLAIAPPSHGTSIPPDSLLLLIHACARHQGWGAA